MTLIVTEGLSRTGKSTILDHIAAERDDVVITKGSGVDQELEWTEHVLQNIKQCGQVYKQNPDQIFIHDRFFSEAAYGQDDEVRRRVLRAAQCFPDTYVVYFTCSMDELQSRNSKDLWRYSDLQERYKRLCSACDSYEIDTGDLSINEAGDKFYHIIDEHA